MDQFNANWLCVFCYTQSEYVMVLVKLITGSRQPFCHVDDYGKKECSKARYRDDKKPKLEQQKKM